jgi:hypothetical protein
MSRLSATSNPTGLKEIDRARVSVRVTVRDGVKYFALTKLDIDDLNVDDSCRVLFIASSNNTSQRYDLGTVKACSKADQALSDLDPVGVQRYRILIRRPDDPLLVASAENLRLSGENNGESLIPMEPADLGQELWRLVLNDTDGPTLQYNSKVFPSAGGAQHNVAFVSLVLPEALRQVLRRIAATPEVLSDETTPFFLWGEWLDSIGADRPDQLEEGEDDRNEWANKVVAKFCDREKMADMLVAEMMKGEARD